MRKMEYDVLVHDGVFQFNEALAVALLILLYGPPREMFRTRDIAVIHAKMQDPDCFVIDVGSEYDITMRNIDHHQDSNLPCAAALIFAQYGKDLIPDSEVREEFKRLLIDYADAHDTNKNNFKSTLSKMTKRVAVPFTIPVLHAIVRSYNRQPGTPEQHTQFKKAVNHLVEIVENTINDAELFKKSKSIWKDRKELSDHLVALDKPCRFWSQLLGRKHRYVLQPHSKGWVIYTKDSKKYPLHMFVKGTNVNAIKIAPHMILTQKQSEIAKAANLIIKQNKK